MWAHKGKKTDGGRRRSSPTTERKVFSYYQSRVIPDQESIRATSEREREHKVRFRQQHLLTLAILLVLGGCFIYILSLSSNPKVLIVNAQEQATSSLLRPEETYHQAAEKVLKSSLLNKSKLSINTASVAHELQREFPEIAQATVSLPLINRRPVFYLQITQPAFLIQQGNNTYAIDGQGRVIMKGDATLPHTDLIKVEDQTNQEAVIGKPFLPASQVAFLKEVSGQMQARNIEGFSYILPPLPNEVYLKPNDKPYFIKMTFSDDARAQAGTYLAVKEKLEADRVTPSEYIDVRVEDRAYYR